MGATCPEDRLHLLLPLLEPSGGKLLAPVDNDLRLYSRGPDGKLRQRVVSSVRFSDLEVGEALTGPHNTGGGGRQDRGREGGTPRPCLACLRGGVCVCVCVCVTWGAEQGGCRGAVVVQAGCDQQAPGRPAGVVTMLLCCWRVCARCLLTR